MPTKSNTDITILSDDAIAEIEAHSAKVPDGPWYASADDAEDVPDHRQAGLALVDTGRSSDFWIARLCEWHEARFIAASKTNVDALCQTVRAERERADSNYASYERVKGLYSDTIRQLKQVTKERDLLRIASANPEDRELGSTVYDGNGNYTLLAQNAIDRNARDASTRMRDACVKKVKAMRDRSSLASNDPFVNGVRGAYNSVIAELSSLTLDTEQEKQQQ